MMTAEQARVVRQSGVIPYRVRRGRIEVAMVTASSGPHWTIPKGHVEPDLTPFDSAAKEAFEEAGVLGTIETERIGSYVYEKRGRRRVVEVYLLEVTRVLDRWPEMAHRRRRWMSVTEAAKLAIVADLRRCILSLESLVASNAA